MLKQQKKCSVICLPSYSVQYKKDVRKPCTLTPTKMFMAEIDYT